MASQLLAVSYISLSRPDILPCVGCRQYLSPPFPVCYAQQRRIAPKLTHTHMQPPGSSWTMCPSYTGCRWQSLRCSRRASS